uniref:Uncharacterized protein n=1 Tax=Arundo donax TaxID=35708 RepID=A0A0A9GHB9_ARUDO
MRLETFGLAICVPLVSKCSPFLNSEVYTGEIAIQNPHS